MVSNKLHLNLAAAFIIVLRRFVFLIFTPYKTMRKITFSGDYYQVAVILLITLVYFLVSQSIRGVGGGIVAFCAFLILFSLTVSYFYLFAKPFRSDININSFVFAFAYTLVPTLLWFWSNMALYVLLPPPRTMSLLGKGFSVVFVAYSLSLLIWKVILVYFAIRFASRLGLYRIVYMLLIYAAIFIPVSVLLYYLHIFRVPYI